MYQVALDTMGQEADFTKFTECYLIEEFFAFFFSDGRTSYHSDDTLWFFNFVNSNTLAVDTQVKSQVISTIMGVSNTWYTYLQSHIGTLSNSILKYYLAKILGVGTNSGPLSLYQSDYRRQIGHVLHSAIQEVNQYYIPRYYQTEGASYPHSVDMVCYNTCRKYLK